MVETALICYLLFLLLKVRAAPVVSLRVSTINRNSFSGCVFTLGLSGFQRAPKISPRF